MIFAVRLSNIHTLLKLISLLVAIHVIIALPSKKTPLQCVQCREWSHRQKIAQNVRDFINVVVKNTFFSYINGKKKNKPICAITQPDTLYIVSSIWLIMKTAFFG